MTRNYRWNIQRKFHGEWIFHDICRDTRGIKWRNAKCNRNARDLIAKRLPFSILKTKKKNRHRKIEAFKRGRGGEKERKRRVDSRDRASSMSTFWETGMWGERKGKGRWVRNGGHLEDKASVLVEKAGRWIGTRCNVCERMAEKEVEKKAGLSEWNGARRWTGGLRGAVKKMATKKVKLTRARPGKKTRYDRPFIRSSTNVTYG